MEVDTQKPIEIIVPLPLNSDREHPLHLVGRFDGGEIRLSITGPTHFSNLLGKTAYNEYLMDIGYVERPQKPLDKVRRGVSSIVSRTARLVH